jgi:hypothetical protein
MPLLVPNVGEVRMLELILSSSFTLRLYKNDKTPDESDTFGSYVEADFAGYTSMSLNGGSWTITSGEPTSASYPQQSFTSSITQTPQSIYGYYVVDSSNILMWAERFSNGPYNVVNADDVIKLTPKIELS